MTFNLKHPPLFPESLRESHELIEVLWKHARDLEEKQKTNSGNSSKPPSSDFITQPKKGKSKRRSGPKRKAGGQPGHEGKTRNLLPLEEVDSTVTCLPPETCECGCEVTVKAESFRRHQVFELPTIKPTVTEYQQVFGHCKGCGKQHFGELPAGVASLMLGPRALATIGALSGEYRMSKRLKVKLFSDYFNIPLSVSTLCKAEKMVGEALGLPFAQAHEYVKAQAAVHCDETGHKRSGSKMWMWVAVAAQAVVFLIRDKCDTASAQAG